MISSDASPVGRPPLLRSHRGFLLGNREGSSSLAVPRTRGMDGRRSAACHPTDASTSWEGVGCSRRSACAGCGQRREGGGPAVVSSLSHGLPRTPRARGTCAATAPCIGPLCGEGVPVLGSTVPPRGGPPSSARSRSCDASRRRASPLAHLCHEMREGSRSESARPFECARFAKAKGDGAFPARSPSPPGRSENSWSTES